MLGPKPSKAERADLYVCPEEPSMLSVQAFVGRIFRARRFVKDFRPGRFVTAIRPNIPSGSIRPDLFVQV